MVQESKPNKRVYSPTPAGRERLRGWLEGSIRWPDLRHHMMSGADRALKALEQAGAAGTRNGELAGRLLDIVCEFSG